MVFRLFKILVLITLFLIAGNIYAQWSTSTFAESALYVCPGLYSNALVFDDGSSIISGTLASYIFLQKLDPTGYPLWAQPIVAHYNDSTDNWGNAGLISDGKGGVILIWKDHRDAYYDEFGYWNEAYYLQRVDKDGNVCWTPGGVLAAPAISGVKAGNFFPDGKGGAMLAWIEKGYTYQYPNAPNRSNLKIARFDENGNKLWEKIIDSLFKDKMFYQDFKKAGKYLYLEYRLVDSLNRDNYLTRIIDTSGVASLDSIWYGYYAHRSFKDSILFSLSYPLSGGRQLIKIGSLQDVFWDKTYYSNFGCSGTGQIMNTALIPDETGGLYHVRSCEDSVLHFNSDNGEITNLVFKGIDSIGGYIFCDGNGGIILANLGGLAQRYNSIGTPSWGSPIIYQSDPDNSYFENFYGDNNGGIMTTYWTTHGGIFAQHTGRYGKVGIVPVRDEVNPLPLNYSLYQNFPNPFNNSTTLQFSIPSRTRVNVSVYDVLGRIVSVIVDEELEANIYRVTFDGSNLSTGLYFYELSTNYGRKIKPMVLIK